MTSQLKSSYAQCRHIARRSKSSFYHTFWLLPRVKRRSMYALYAFLRLIDDAADGSAALPDRRQALAAWRHDLQAALGGQPAAGILPALVDTVYRHGIDPAYLLAAIDGVEMDLSTACYETFDDLAVYCRRVASGVGLACLAIWGFDGPQAVPLAEKCGLAFQLTNILRDLQEDARRGRVYLPQEELRRFAYSPQDLRCEIVDDRFRGLIGFQIARARQLFREGRRLASHLHADGRPIFAAMWEAYYALLLEIERRDCHLFTRRISLSRTRRLGIAGAAIAKVMI